MIAPGAITSFWIGSGQFYNADVQDALDNYTGLTALQVGAINAFINAEGANYDTYDEFFLYPLGALNGLTGFKGTLGVNVEEATFDIGGILVDGADQFFDTTIIPSSGLTKASLNDIDIQCFVKDNLDTGQGPALFGVIGGSGNNLSIVQQTTQDRLNASVNRNGGTNLLLGDDGFIDETLYGLHRDDSSNAEVYKDGVQAVTAAQASTGLPDEAIYLGARNNNTTADFFINAKISTYKIGASIGFSQSLHNTNVRQLLTTLGTI